MNVDRRIIAWRHFYSKQKSPTDDLVAVYGETIEIQCSSLILREAFINKTIRDSEAKAFAATPELAAQVAKAVPNFLFSEKETHEAVLAEIQLTEDFPTQQRAVAATPKLKSILAQRQNSFYEKCANTHARIWEGCKKQNEDLAPAQKCFEEKAITPESLEELIVLITPRQTGK